MLDRAKHILKPLMLQLYTILGAVAFALLANAAALMAGQGKATALRRSAILSGSIGIFLILCIPISLFFALGSWYVDLIHDASIFFFSALYGSAFFTLTSMGLSAVIFRVDRRAKDS